MSNKKISFEEKEIVKQELAKGASYREALVYIDRLSGIDKDAPDTSIEIRLAPELEELAT